MQPYYEAEGVALYHGDCVEAMAALPEASVDAIVTDPPYGLEFMGKDWDAPWRSGDGFRRSRNEADAGRDDPFGRASRSSPEYIAGEGFERWTEAWAHEALRVLRPGGYLVAAGGTRTSHRLVCGLEDAGFEIRDSLVWLFGQGFPKSLNVSDALRRLSACTCDVANEVGAVDAVRPAGAVRAGVGTEPGAVAPAGQSTNLAGRVGPDVGADAARSGTGVGERVEQVVGNAVPVVLGAGSVAGLAGGDEIGPNVGGVEVSPETLGDDVVREDGGTAAVDAGGAAHDDGADRGPVDPLVTPLASAPSGVTGPVEPMPVGETHAPAGTVDGRPSSVTGRERSAPSAGEGLHDLQCATCGGVRGRMIPEGLGTALKPGHEPIVLARKPLVGTVAANVLAHGTGALNIDAARIGEGASPSVSKREGSTGAPRGMFREGFAHDSERYSEARPGELLGRWPANVVLDPEAAAMLDAQAGDVSVNPAGVYADDQGAGWRGGRNNIGSEGTATRSVFGYGDSGGPSRFYYCAKASRGEREFGLWDLPLRRRVDAESRDADAPGSSNPRLRVSERRNDHPTVKPIALMRWLVRLIVPPGGLVLDPFLGSGTTGIAALLEDATVIGIDQDQHYLEIAWRRIARRHLLADHPEPSKGDIASHDEDAQLRML